MDDTRPFPIQAHSHRGKTGKMIHHKRHTIPWWLAKEAYLHYVKLFGNIQSLDRLAQRGGFGRQELLMLLRQEDY